MTQFCACKFRPNDTRAYTYRNDGEPVSSGDRVIVATDRGEQTVTVIEITDQSPGFACKAIIGLAPPKEEQPPAERRPVPEIVDEDPLGLEIGF